MFVVQYIKLKEKYYDKYHNNTKGDYLMSTTTSNLELFKYDTEADQEELFNLDTALNNNWDKIDKVGTLQNIEILSSGTINLSNKSIYAHTASAATTYTFSTTNLGLTSNSAYTFELVIIMSSAVALTFPASVTWQDDEEPDLSNTGTYFFAFRTIDGGSTWKGSLQGVWQ